MTKTPLRNPQSRTAIFGLIVILIAGFVALTFQRFKVHVYVNSYSSGFAFGPAVEMTSDDSLPESGASSHDLGYDFQAGHIVVFLERKRAV